VAQLCRDAKRDEEAIRAATKVFAEHGRFIRTVIRFQANDASLEDDLFQEFFLSLIRRPLPADVRNVKSYLYRAITNDVVDFARRQEKYRRHLRKHAEEIRISINKKTPDDAALETEEVRSVFGCLTRHLRHRESQVVTMRFRDNYSIGEIAAKMGVDKRTVSRYLSSGLSRLRKILAVE
jgi:RNA polymerase sigma factor (sigma-70 family)